MFVVQLLWGIVLIGTGFANNFPTLIALRVILGALEAPIVPGNFLIISMWYPRREQPLRTGLMYVSHIHQFHEILADLEPQGTPVYRYYSLAR